MESDFFSRRDSLQRVTHGCESHWDAPQLFLECIMIDKAVKASDGVYDSEMAYGWAYNLNAWEAIHAMACRSKKDAKEVLLLIEDMELHGVSEFPKNRYYMREVIRAANATIRNDDLQHLLKRKR